jgi:hypothetical protein
MTNQTDVLEKSAAMAKIGLTATTDASGTVVISGDNSKKTCPKGSGPHNFRFSLTDNTNPAQNVQFASLDAADNCSTCPPPSGQNSTQITDVTIDDGGLSASFKDKNNNSTPMDVSYAWNFKCDNGQTPQWDPIIDNRGT